MMRFSYLDLDHHHQEDLRASSSSSLAAAAPSFLGLASNLEWNQSLVVGVASVPALNTQATQEVGFQWADIAEDQLPSPSLDITKIKEDLPDSFSPGAAATNPSKIIELDPIDEKLYLRTLDSDTQMSNPAVSLLREPLSLVSFGGSRENFSMAFPTTAMDSEYFSPHLNSYSGSFSMDLQHLDLLSSARLDRDLYQASVSEMPALLREDTSNYGICHLQEPDRGPSYYHQKMPSLTVSGVTETKRASSILERIPSQTASKRPRFEQRSSFSPFKVRKEKLGDRIAALQQLVAPFGKTDTASVLMEAIGYIKFLQDQIETLSVPYMRSSGNKGTKATQEASGHEGDNGGISKPDLGSRGLCLVPLACISYMASEHEGGWSPPNYQGLNFG